MKGDSHLFRRRHAHGEREVLCKKQHYPQQTQKELAMQKTPHIVGDADTNAAYCIKGEFWTDSG